MERFLPILDVIQTRLRDILSRNESYMLSWDMANIDNIGEELIRLSLDVYRPLMDAQHRVLSLSLREAGLGIKDRVFEIQNRRLEEKDKEYFRSVHEALRNICEKIETGEYYEALLSVAAKSERIRKEEDYVT